MRKIALVFPLLLVLVSTCFATPHVMQASTFPEPGILVALGSGLVGLATLVRNRFSK